MERLDKYSGIIHKEVPNLHLYQFVIVRDVLGYSRDMGSRNTLWIPDDFAINEFIKYCKQECISDPKLLPLRQIDTFLNPFQPINWFQVSNINKLDGSYGKHGISRGKNISLKMTTDNEISKSNNLQRRNIDPIELLKLREKARNSIMKNEQYIDTSDIFTYKNKTKNAYNNRFKKRDGRDSNVPKYIIPEESTHVENRTNYEEQVIEMQHKYRETLKEEQMRRMNQLNETDKDLLSFELDTGEDDEDNNKINTSDRGGGTRPLSIEYDYNRWRNKKKNENPNDLRIELSQQQEYWNYLDARRNDPQLKYLKTLNKSSDGVAGFANTGGIINASNDNSQSYMDNVMLEEDGNASDLDENDSGDDEEDIEYPQDFDVDNDNKNSEDDDDDGEETDYEEYDQIESEQSQSQQQR